MMDLGPEAAVEKTPGRLALGAAVFSSQLLPILPELLVKPRISQDVPLRHGLFIRSQKILIEEDPDLPIFHFQHDFLINGPVRNDVAVGVEGDLTVAVDFPECL